VETLDSQIANDNVSSEVINDYTDGLKQLDSKVLQSMLSVPMSRFQTMA
jgi:hypothetical protein